MDSAVNMKRQGQQHCSPDVASDETQSVVRAAQSMLRSHLVHPCQTSCECASCLILDGPFAETKG